MNETDLRRGLDDAVAAGSPPLALDAAGMLAHARRTRRMRIAGVSGGSTVLAAALALGVVLALPNGAGGSGGAQAAGQQSGCRSAPPSPDGGAPTATKVGKDGRPVPGQPTDAPAAYPTPTGGQSPTCPGPTETEWPDGQGDRTARSGPHFQKGVELQAALLDLVPAGFAAVSPENQAQFDHYVGKVQVWETQASAGVRKAGRTGSLLVENISADPASAHKPLCTVAAAQFGGRAADCQTLLVNGKTVAFFDAGSSNYSPELAQWAAYRNAQGAITYVAQGKVFMHLAEPVGKPLTALPFTKSQLAALATSSRLGA
jgi:hypothetical protein